MERGGKVTSFRRTRFLRRTRSASDRIPVESPGVQRQYVNRSTDILRLGVFFDLYQFSCRVFVRLEGLRLLLHNFIDVLFSTEQQDCSWTIGAVPGTRELVRLEFERLSRLTLLLQPNLNDGWYPLLNAKKNGLGTGAAPASINHGVLLKRGSSGRQLATGEDKPVCSPGGRARGHHCLQRQTFHLSPVNVCRGTGEINLANSPHLAPNSRRKFLLSFLIRPQTVRRDDDVTGGANHDNRGR